MSEQIASRRAILSGAGCLAAAGALAAVPAGASALALPSAIFEHRKAVADLDVALERSDFTEEIEDALYAKIPAAAERLWSLPVKSWADVVARAELAAWWTQDDLWDGCKSLEDPGRPIECICLDDRAIAALIEAVFIMAKGGANV